MHSGNILLCWWREMYTLSDLSVWFFAAKGFLSIDTFDKIDNFALIVLTITVHVFVLGMSFGKVKSGNIDWKLRRIPVTIVHMFGL